MIIKTICENHFTYVINRITPVAEKGSAYVPEADASIVFVKAGDIVVFESDRKQSIMKCQKREVFKNIVGLFLTELLPIEAIADIFKGRIIDK